MAARDTPQHHPERLTLRHRRWADGRSRAVRTGYRFAAFLDLTNLNPLQGFGSQLLPINVWINPVHWPLAFIDGKSATDIAGLVGLTCVAAACYVMARCFDLPPLPSIIAAQLSLCWFGPVGPLLTFTASFVLLPGMAAVYAPYIAALGLLARIDPGRIRNFVLYSAAIAALIFYSVGCDPLWSTVAAVSWAVPFAVVALSPLRIKAVALRCAALAITFALLLGSGALLYIYTLTQYTARVYFSVLLERRFAPSYVSILLSSPYAKYYYELCILGWVIGLHFRCGSGTCARRNGFRCFHFLFILRSCIRAAGCELVAAVALLRRAQLGAITHGVAFAGLWSAAKSISAQNLLTRIPLSLGTLLPSAMNVRFSRCNVDPSSIGSAREFIGTRIRLPFAMTQPGATACSIPPCVLGSLYRWPRRRGSRAARRNGVSFERAKIVLAQYYSTPWPNEPELAAYLLQSTGLSVGQAYRGSSLFFAGNIVSTANLWKRGCRPSMSTASSSPRKRYIEGALLGSGQVSTPSAMACDRPRRKYRPSVQNLAGDGGPSHPRH